MKTNDIKISKLKLAEYNPRKIADKELSNLKKSLEKFGFIQPVVINKDFTVISGHQRIKAWKEMGNETVPTIQLAITKNEEKALNLAMNRIGGEWDIDKLYSVMNDLRVTDELEFTGFDEKEVSKILDQFIEEEEDEPVEKLLERIPAKAKKGEIYELGDHRLMCGDSTSLDDVMKLTEDRKMDMCFTDPPYNINYEPLVNKKLGKIENDNMSSKEFDEFLVKVFENISITIKNGGVFYICCGWNSYSQTERAIKELGLHLSVVIDWVKTTPSHIPFGEYPHKYEKIVKVRNEKQTKKKARQIFYGWKNGKHSWYGSNDETDVWEMDVKDKGRYLHPTEKPDWLVMKALKNSTKYKDNVIDLFGGSGSCLMAAEKLGRNAYIMELDPRFVDVIIYRWEKYTGKKAKKI